MKSKAIKTLTAILAFVMLLGLAVGIAAFADETAATVDYKNVSYEGQIKLVYYVDAADAEAADGSYVAIRFWEPGVVPANEDEEGYYEKRAHKEDGELYTKTVNDAEYAIYFSHGIEPKRMAEDVYACTVKYNADDSVSTGNLFKFSVKEYVMKRFEAGASDDQVNLYMTLLGYGSAVQKVLEYNVTNLANISPTFPEANESALKTVTFYKPAGGSSYSLSRVNADDIEYKITYKNSTSYVYGEDGSFTLSKQAEITDFSASDGSNNIDGIGVGSVIANRDWLGINTSFRGSGSLTLTPTNTNPIKVNENIISDFNTDMTVQCSGSESPIAEVHLNSGTNGFYLYASSSNVYAYNFKGGSVSGSKVTLGQTGKSFNLRITLSTTDGKTATATLYANGEKKLEHTGLAIPAGNDSIKFALQEWGAIKNYDITFKNTEFIRCEPLPTRNFSNNNGEGATTTTKAYTVDGESFTKTATEEAGELEYTIVWKSTPDKIWNEAANSFTISTHATIVSLTLNGEETELLGLGAGDDIPNRNWLFNSTTFTCNQLIQGNGKFVDVYDLGDRVPDDLLYLFETNVTYYDIVNDPGYWAYKLAIYDNNGFEWNYLFFRSTGGDVYVANKSNQPKKVAKLGEEFNIRFEIRENADNAAKWDLYIVVDGEVVYSQLAQTPPSVGLHTSDAFRFDNNGDSQESNNTIVLRSTKFIKYIHTAQ